MCVIVVLCAGGSGSGEGPGQPAQRRRGCRGGGGEQEGG